MNALSGNVNALQDTWLKESENRVKAYQNIDSIKENINEATLLHDEYVTLHGEVPTMSEEDMMKKVNEFTQGNDEALANKDVEDLRDMLSETLRYEISNVSKIKTDQQRYLVEEKAKAATSLGSMENISKHVKGLGERYLELLVESAKLPYSGSHEGSQFVRASLEPLQKSYDLIKSTAEYSKKAEQRLGQFMNAIDYACSELPGIESSQEESNIPKLLELRNQNMNKDDNLDPSARYQKWNEFEKLVDEGRNIKPALPSY